MFGFASFVDFVNFCDFADLRVFWVFCIWYFRVTLLLWCLTFRFVFVFDLVSGEFVFCCVIILQAVCSWCF